MMKRKCGTCRFFDDRGIAGSGWCQHPARRELRDMVLVRKSELACRNGWDQDMWQPADAAVESDVIADVAQPSVPIVTSNGTSPHASLDARGGQPGDASPYTDKIITTSAARARPSHPPATTLRISSDLPPAFANADPFTDDREQHSDVRDARRRVQEQREAQRYRSTDLHPESAPRTRTPEIPAPSIVDAELGLADLSPRPKTGSYLPPFVTDDEPDVTRVPRTARTRDGLARPPIPTPPSPPAHEPPVAATLVSQPSAPRRSGAASRPGSPRAQQTEQLPIDEVRAYGSSTVVQEPDPVPIRDGKRSAGRASDRAPRNAEAKSPSRSSASGASRLTRAGVPVGAPEQAPITSNRARRAPVATPAVELPAADPVDPIDRELRLRGVPRCCATCRDFRPTSDGDAGWCANPYAIAERRMVKSAELACHSSHGVWWLPHDDLWLERADVTHHGRPTPMMDELMHVPTPRSANKVRSA